MIEEIISRFALLVTKLSHYKENLGTPAPYHPIVKGKKKSSFQWCKVCVYLLAKSIYDSASFMAK